LPPRADVVGEYEEKTRRSENGILLNAATLGLRDDGTMEAEGLPYEAYPTTCVISGKGMEGAYEDGRIDLDLTSIRDGRVCPPGSNSMLELTGRSSPYGLYWVIGDPDSGNGVRLSRKK